MFSEKGIRFEGSSNLLKTAVSSAKFAVEAGVTHALSKRRLEKEGIIWYPFGSLLLPVFKELSGKTLPQEHYPLISYFWEYVRQTDDFFDTSDSFPSWSRTKKAVAPTQSKLVQGIIDAQLSQDKKRAILSEISDLRKKAYTAFEKQSRWDGPVSFRDAFDYRRDSSFLLMRKIGIMGNILVDTDESRRQQVEDGFEAIGVPFQMVDDVMDIEEDQPSDGNLVHAALYDYSEAEAFSYALAKAPDGTKIAHLLQSAAPETAAFITKLTQQAFTRLETISPAVERPVRMCTQFAFNHAKVTREQKGFLSRFFNETHRQVT